MKRALIFLFSFLLIFLFSVVGWTGNETSVDGSNVAEKDPITKCTAYEDEIMEKVLHGRRITAFELCRKQGGSIEECMQRISSISEKWRQMGCHEVSGKALRYYYLGALLDMYRVVEKLKRLKEEADKSRNSLYFPAFAAGINEALMQRWPGSQFSVETGSGKVVFEGGEVYFQGWQWTQFNFRDKWGVLFQVFPNRIDLSVGRYNITFYLDIEPEPRWELIEFNLPFDVQTEKLLIALNQGVRLTEKEIIGLANGFLHDTVWGLDLIQISRGLLTKQDFREDVIKSLVEYYAYDNYIKEEKAKARRQAQPMQKGKASKKR